MKEILLSKGLEILGGFIIMGGLLVIIIVNAWYQKEKERQYDEYADLKKMLPKLPKEK